MEYVLAQAHCKLIIFAFAFFSLCFFANAQTTSSAKCIKPASFSQTEKREYIENIRKTIKGEDDELIAVKQQRVGWVRYFQCLEETELGFSIEKSGLSFQEKARLYNDFAQKALSATLESLDLKANNAEAKTVAAQIVFLTGNKSEASTLVAEAITLDPKNFESHFVLGVIENDLASVERAIALNSNFAPAYQFKVERLINEASNLKDNEQQLKYTTALDTLKTMLSLPSPPSVDFWQEQETSLAAWLESRQIANTKVQNQSSQTEGTGISTKLNILSKPRAKYTELARLMQTTGTVRLKITLSADGQIKNVLVLNFLPHGLTQGAVKAVKQIRFEPETYNGVPISVIKNVEYNFNLY